ncbi:MAG: RNA degradosome polyphosphate kinase [Cellulomonadaceae bacterium]|jgi:polyphosphate kinase|nr:RNA degradosome polyphosphate kinase [Cellulomonadaceae bacterium]
MSSSNATTLVAESAANGAKAEALHEGAKSGFPVGPPVSPVVPALQSAALAPDKNSAAGVAELAGRLSDDFEDHLSEHLGEKPDQNAATTNSSATEEAPIPELPQDRYSDRELSWLSFNARVLELAADETVPLLERVRFLAIFASNLDEFFMVRVAGLKRRIDAGIAVTSISGQSPSELMASISAEAHRLMEMHAALFRNVIRPALAAEGIRFVHWAELEKREQERIFKYYRKQILPVLTPLAVDPAHPFPYISGLSLNLAVIVRNPKTEKEHFARVKVPGLLPRFLAIDERGRPMTPETFGPTKPFSFVPVEEVIAQHLDTLFPGMDVIEYSTFRVTRNEQVEVEEDDAENLLKAMEKELLRRRFGPAVRLELAKGTSQRVRNLLTKELGVADSEVYELPAPLDLTGLFMIADLERASLKYPAFVPKTHRKLAEVESANPSNFFDAIKRGDILLHHPYDSFSTSVQNFLEQAAADPNVLAIKQTLYRTSGDSPIVDALIEAAQAGKQVLALVEIKARFDEEANIKWARKLERSGVHVVYGIVGLKTHAKLSLVVRQERDGLVRYCHIGTGNYHPKTARLYTDHGLLTCDPRIGEDLTKLFNQLSGYAPQSRYRQVLVAPREVRLGLIERINREIEAAKAGKPAWIKIKVNSIVDEATIDALYRASQAGVQIDMVVRGICALRPGIPGLSENIRVYSILGRFLEHSRIYAFANAGDPVEVTEGSEPAEPNLPEVLIGSADLMHRNLDRRVEALIVITDPDLIAELLWLLDESIKDTTSSWRLGADNTWVRHNVGPDGEPLLDLQSELIARHGRKNRSKA